MNWTTATKESPAGEEKGSKFGETSLSFLWSTHSILILIISFNEL